MFLTSLGWAALVIGPIYLPIIFIIFTSVYLPSVCSYLVTLQPLENPGIYILYYGVSLETMVSEHKSWLPDPSFPERFLRQTYVLKRKAETCVSDYHGLGL